MDSKAATITSVDWTKARIKPHSEAELVRDADIFQGGVEHAVGSLLSVQIERFEVSPVKGTKPPASFAVTADAESSIQWKRTANYKKDSTNQKILEIEWQQSRAGRWDFYFDLPAGVVCLGLGERFSGLNLRSGIHTLVSTDQPHHNEGADSLYKSIPFLIMVEPDSALTRAIFIDSPAPQIWDLDSSLNNSAHVKMLSRRGFTFYLLGPAPLPDMINAFTGLTGKAAMPPLWSLGHQQCRWSYPDEQTVLSIGHEFRDRNIPCDTVVLDIDYMDEYRVFTHSPTRFPHFADLSNELKKICLNTITIVDPGVKQDESYSIYQEAVEQDLVCKTADGLPFTDQVWPGTCVFPDFLKEETRRWWAQKLAFYTNNGVAGIWNDMNEPAFFSRRKEFDASLDEMPPGNEHRFIHETAEGPVGHLEVRNLYGFLMSRATHEALQLTQPQKRPFVLTRSAYAGIQKYSAVWLGDNMSWYEHLKKSIPMLLNVGLSGVSFAGVDIGGFGGNCTAELLIRWYEVGIFNPFFRNHCRMGDRAQEPWAFGPQVENKIRNLINERYRLLPYIYALFHEHTRTGAPLMRPLVWHFPTDARARQIDDEFMVGADILVTPVLDKAQTIREVYLPKGRWYPFAGGEPLEGGRTYTLDFPLGMVPAFVREGAILPLCDSPVQSTVDMETAAIVFKIYGDTASGAYYEDDGISTNYLDGAYNAYSLSFADDKFEFKSIQNGWTSQRKFSYEHNGKRTAIESR